jgi:hypothetical protein
MPDYGEANVWMLINKELGRMLQERSWSNLKYYPNIFLKGLRKTT